MAAVLQNDLRNRKIEVNRRELLVTLESNKEKHIREYEEAKAGYRDSLLSKMEEAVKEARNSLEKQYDKFRREVSELTDADIAKREDYVRLFDHVTIEMKVPRSFAKEYEAAIDMAKWDVRETLELTHAEFTCFVRDEWDWKGDFTATSAMYLKKLA